MKYGNFLYLQERQLDQLRKLKDKVKTPEGVPRLFDLVAVKDEKLKLAFFATLGNTVVAKDLDQVFLSLYLMFIAYLCKPCNFIFVQWIFLS